MTNDTHLAFAHPSERAKAAAQSASNDPLRDRISVRDYVLEVEIGAFQTERGITQRVRFNVAVEVTGASQAAATDDVDRVLSYDRITEAIDGALAEERLNLLETLAERVAERILTEPQAHRVFLRIEKIDRGPYALGVEVVRDRGGLEGAGEALQEGATDGASEELRPRIVHLSNPAIAAADLKDRLDRWQEGDVPLILTVGPAEAAPPQSAAPLAQRRIDLLAIEQNAWVLAGRDRRCIVVGSRTELDWAMRHGQISVWAPSKIVLDAVDGPSIQPGDTIALVQWFAQEMGASDLVLTGVPVPKSGFPARTEPV